MTVPPYVMRLAEYIWGNPDLKKMMDGGAYTDESIIVNGETSRLRYDGTSLYGCLRGKCPRIYVPFARSAHHEPKIELRVEIKIGLERLKDERVAALVTCLESEGISGFASRSDDKKTDAIVEVAFGEDLTGSQLMQRDDWIPWCDEWIRKAYRGAKRFCPTRPHL